MENRRSYSVRLLPTIFKALKLLAVKKEKTISGILEEAITDLLQKYEKESKKKLQ
jgi:predicted transcriptional regulator